MDSFDPRTVERYLITLRTIQPARVQDVIAAYGEVWDVEVTPDLVELLKNLHENLRADSKLVTVRKGTYVLNKAGMLAVAGLLKVRVIDNSRLFLMKQQRKKYHG